MYGPKTESSISMLSDEEKLSRETKHLTDFLTSFEAKRRMYARYNIKSLSENPELEPKDVLDILNDFIQVLLGVDLYKIEDFQLQKLICAAAFNDESCMDVWKECENPILSGIMVTYICEGLRKRFSGFHEDLVANDFATLREKFDLKCTQLLSMCNKADYYKTKTIMEIDYSKILIARDKTTGYKKLELMQIALLGKAMNFLSHPVCQRFVDLRWQPNYKLGEIIIYFYWFFMPILVFSRSGETGKFRYIRPNKREMKIWPRLATFYRSPAAKYVTHNIHRISFIIFYSMVISLVPLTREQYIFPFAHITNLKAIATIWLFLILSEFIINASRRRFQTKWAYFMQNPFDSIQCILLFTNIICIIGATIELPRKYNFDRFILFRISDIIFYLSYIMASLQLITIFNIDSNFGNILEILKTLKHVAKFLLLMLIIWIIYALCLNSIIGQDFGNESMVNTSIVWRFFSYGAFEIFGETEDSRASGTSVNCTEIDGLLPDTYFLCQVRSWLVPLLMFSYMIAGSIILINLLTARMTKRYDDLAETGHLRQQMYMYERLLENERRIMPIIILLINLPVHWCFPKCALEQNGKKGNKPNTGSVLQLARDQRKTMIEDEGKEAAKTTILETNIEMILTKLKSIEIDLAKVRESCKRSSDHLHKRRSSR